MTIERMEELTRGSKKERSLDYLMVPPEPFVASGIEEQAKNMARWSISSAPTPTPRFEGTLPEIAEALSHFTIDDPNIEERVEEILKNPEKATDDDQSLLAQVATAKAITAESERNLTPKEKKGLDKLKKTVVDGTTKTIAGVGGSKALRLAAASSLALSVAACKPSVAPETEVAPTAVSTIAAVETPTAGAEDEMSIGVQNYLNESCPELGIFGAKVLVERLSDNQGNTYAFVEAQFRADGEGEARRLPLMIKMGENDQFGDIIILQENPDGNGEYLVEREFLGYQYDPSQQSFVDLGAFLHYMRVGEFQTNVDGQWVVIRAMLDQHMEPMEAFLTAENLARPTETVNVVQPETEVGEEYPPLVQPESLILDMTESEVRSLNRISSADAFVSYVGRADDIIRMMGVSEYPDLVQQYTDFFDGQWGVTPFFEWARTDIRGLGAEPAGVETSWQETGFFYGFVDEGPGYMVIQIRPGSNLNPTDNPESFISLRIARPYGDETVDRNYAQLGLRDINEHGGLAQLYTIKTGRTNASMENWSIEEIIEYFGLQRGTIITTSNGQDSSGYYTPEIIFIQMNEMPEEDQISGYSLANSYW